jgi:hypothetical protein
VNNLNLNPPKPLADANQRDSNKFHIVSHLTPLLPRQGSRFVPFFAASPSSFAQRAEWTPGIGKRSHTIAARAAMAMVNTLGFTAAKKGFSFK